MCDYYCSYLLDSFPPACIPSFSIILLTHGQEQVPDVDSYRTAQQKQRFKSMQIQNTQAHKFIPIPICFLNSLQVPLSIHSV